MGEKYDRKEEGFFLGRSRAERRALEKLMAKAANVSVSSMRRDLEILEEAGMLEDVLASSFPSSVEVKSDDSRSLG